MPPQSSTAAQQPSTISARSVKAKAGDAGTQPDAIVDHRATGGIVAVPVQEAAALRPRRARLLSDIVKGL
jgi:hypothetical protein